MTIQSGRFIKNSTVYYVGEVTDKHVYISYDGGNARKYKIRYEGEKPYFVSHGEKIYIVQ